MKQGSLKALVPGQPNKKTPVKLMTGVKLIAIFFRVENRRLSLGLGRGAARRGLCALTLGLGGGAFAFGMRATAKSFGAGG